MDRTEMLNGSPLHLRQIGNGPPVLFLHGSATLPGAAPWMSQLGKTHTVFAPDLPGFGRSPLPDHVRSLVQMSVHLSELPQRLANEPMVLMGTSMGGHLALLMALANPQHFSHLILINSAGLYLPESPPPVLGELSGQEMAERLFAHPERMGIWGKNPRDRATFIPDEETVALLQRDPLPLEDLRQISIPTLVIWGRHDGIFPLIYGEMMATEIPQAQLKIFDDSGHLPHLEQAALFIDAIIKALHS